MKRICLAVRILALTLAVCLLSACGDETSPADNVPEELSVCIGGSIGTLDPAHAESAQDMTVLAHLYENLMKQTVDRDGNVSVVPAMAKNYETEINPDGSVTYTFRLRSARWSDGVAVSAEDFVCAWQRLADPATASPHARLLSVVAGFDEVQTSGDPSLLQVEAVSSSVFSVTLTGVCEWFLTDVCTATATMPLRSTAVQRMAETAAEDPWTTNPAQLVLNGPYCIEAWDDTTVILAQNRRYAGNDGPDRIVLRRADSAETGWALYESGTVDLLAQLPDAQLAKLAEDPEWSPVVEPATCTLLFNTAAGVFADPAVRQAFQLTIDRTALQQAAGVSCTPAGGLVPTSVPDPDADAEAPGFRGHGGELVNTGTANLGAGSDAALNLLADNGYDIEFGWAPVQLIHPDTARHAETARLLAERWGAILNANITPVAKSAEELEADLAAGNYMLALTDITGYVNDAYAFLDRWETGDPRNVTGYSNSAFDTLLSVIRSIGDDAARRGCLHDAESLLLEDCPLSPLYFLGTDYAVREDLAGIVRDPRGFFRLTDVRRVELP